MKKHTKKVLLGAATVAALSGFGHAAKAANNDDVAISAVIIQAISLTATTTLKFGTFSYTGAGTIDVPANGAATPSASINLIGGEQPGGFQIKGSIGQTAQFSLPTATVTIKHATAADTMKVGSFVFGTANVTVGAYTVPLTAATMASLPIGGTLNIAGTEAAGTYSGVVNVATSYQ